jgi:hypothetical protein
LFSYLQDFSGIASPLTHFWKRLYVKHNRLSNIFLDSFEHFLGTDACGMPAGKIAEFHCFSTFSFIRRPPR